MNAVQFDLGFERSPYVTLAEFLASRSAWAERCRLHGWFTETLERIEAGGSK